MPNGVFAWLLILPAMIILLGFSVLPGITTIWTSLQEPGIDATIGPVNYERMIADGVFLQSLRNNLVFSVVTVPVSLAIAMLMAVLVDREIRARGFLRMAFFTPAMPPVVAAATMWLALYQPNFGLIHVIAESIGLPGQNWLGNPTTALPALMVVMVWKEAGFFMPFYLAGLQTISPELNEALVITQSVESRPITVGIYRFLSPEIGINFTALTAGTVITVLPLLALFLVAQRMFIQNFLRSGIK